MQLSHPYSVTAHLSQQEATKEQHGFLVSTHDLTHTHTREQADTSTLTHTTRDTNFKIMTSMIMR